MGALTRTYDWPQTAIGSPDRWPQSLRTTLGIVLHSAFPMFLFWGDEHICFYNDAYRPSFGHEGKHPALGKRGEDVWGEIWPFIGPLIDQVMTTGDAVWYEDQLVPFYRNGKLEDIYWTFSYSPVYGDEGHIDGVLVTCTETTENVQTIHKLKETNDQLAFAIDATELGTWDLDPASNAFSANERLKEWFGLPADGQVALPLATSVVAEKDRQRVDEAIQWALQYASGGHYDIDYTLVHPVTKDERIVRAKGKAWFTPDRVAYRFNGTLQDITDRKKAEQEVAASAQALRSIIESAPFPIGIYVGPQMQIQFANSAIITIWGKGPDVVGKRYADLLPELESQGIYAQLDRVYETGIPFHARHQRVDLDVDGRLQPFYFNYSFTPLYNAEGQIYGVMNTGAEVTDLIEAKQKLEDTEATLLGAIELAKLATWRLDASTRAFSCSERFMDWLGLSDKAKVQNEDFNPLPARYRQQVIEAIEEAIQPGSSGYYENEHPIINQLTGQVRIIHAQGRVFYDADGNPAVLSGTAQDITQQREVQLTLERQVQERTEELESTNEELTAINEELTEANQLLIRSNDNLQQFAYVASHDLQEPLRKIQQFSTLLKQEYAASLDDKGKDFLDRLTSASSRMSMLIKDLLTFSRISTQQVTHRRVDLNDVLREVLENLSIAVDESKAVIQIDPLPVIEGDALQLGQLFQNLLSNAIKFHQPGVRPVVQIRISQLLARDLPLSLPVLRQSKAYYCLDIADNGIGFDEKYKDRIFQVFQRLHSKREFVGTGIGLAICQKVAANHGGAITATSEPNRGATFSVYLPV
ncbi:PAS domain-containing protein [Spirosoma aerolatum]